LELVWRLQLNFRKIPKVLQSILPAGGYDIHEEAWNAYPYCKTIVTVVFQKNNLISLKF
jgi:hypothetical protein